MSRRSDPLDFPWCFLQQGSSGPGPSQGHVGRGLGHHFSSVVAEWRKRVFKCESLLLRSGENHHPDLQTSNLLNNLGDLPDDAQFQQQLQQLYENFIDSRSMKVPLCLVSGRQMDAIRPLVRTGLRVFPRFKSICLIHKRSAVSSSSSCTAGCRVENNACSG